jgi:MSHA biogenesis protein MshP
VSGQRGQAGFSLVSAIFLLVVLSLAAASMVSLVGTSRRTASFGLLGARAYQAARSGVEWAAAEALATPGTCPSGSFSLNEAALSGFDVTVSCALTQHEENATTTRVLVIESVARYGSFGDPDFVSRRVELTLTVGS